MYGLSLIIDFIKTGNYKVGKRSYFRQTQSQTQIQSQMQSQSQLNNNHWNIFYNNHKYEKLKTFEIINTNENDFV